MRLFPLRSLPMRAYAKLFMPHAYGHMGLDHKVAKYLPRHPGFFVELGANDGIRQSNTLYLERERGWTGILIEPVPGLARQCAANRPGSITVHCACTSPEAARRGTLRMTDCGLMSVVSSRFGKQEERDEWLKQARQAREEDRGSIDVPCRTLSDVLEEHGVQRIDLLSLDVEGYETEVLAGLDLSKHMPDLILAEIQVTPMEKIREALGRRYELVRVFHGTDALFRPAAAGEAQ